MKVSLFILLWLSSISLFGQINDVPKKAQKLYEEAGELMRRRQYPEAVEALKAALAKEEHFYEAHHRLAGCYKILNNFPEASRHFERMISLAGGAPAAVYFDLGECYFLQGEYEKAVNTMEDFLSMRGASSSLIANARRILESAKFAAEGVKRPSSFNPQPLTGKINNFAMQYFPALTADEKSIIFTKRDGPGMQHDEDIYISRKDEQGEWMEPESISAAINTSFNEGTSSISADGRTLIFTSCQGRKTYGSCDLFISHKIGDHWSEPENLGPKVNSPAWESQPSLSPDGRTLYFVSDRRGGLGRRDIWASHLGDDGEWSQAVNLGPPVNTAEDEVSPFIHANNRTLYFASKGFKGFGGFDLYSSELIDGRWTEPENLGYPLNTHHDEVSLFITPNGRKGYYAIDERHGGLLVSSRIFSFDIPEEIRVRVRSSYVAGKIYDAVTGKPLGAKIELYDLETRSLASTVGSDSVNGRYMVILNEGSEYALYVEKEGYLFKSVSFGRPEGSLEPVVLDVPLDPVEQGKIVALNNIFFEHDKYALQERSLPELRKTVDFLKKNPDVRIEISGHTDNTGDALYNKELSEKRARSVYDFLVKHGIEQHRISSVGYGDTRPVASNDSEENRAKNRRIEFRIL